MMKINIDSETMDLLMPECRRLDVSPQKLVKEILMNYFNKNSTKKVELGGKRQRKN